MAADLPASLADVLEGVDRLQRSLERRIRRATCSAAVRAIYIAAPAQPQRAPLIVAIRLPALEECWGGQ